MKMIITVIFLSTKVRIMKILNTIHQIIINDSVPPFDALSRYLQWQIWRIFHLFPKTIRFCNSKVLVEKHSGVAIFMYIFNLYDFNNMSLIKNSLIANSELRFIDVGANIGAYSIISAETRARVTAFEPHPETFASLVNNVNLNKFSNISTINMAVSDKNGQLNFTNSAELEINRLDINGSLSVQSTTLDDYLKNIANGKYLVKIDVEGSELEVIYGLQEHLNDCEILFVENGNRPQIISHLHEHGFKGPFYYHAHINRYLTTPQRRHEDEIFLRESLLPQNELTLVSANQNNRKNDPGTQNLKN